MGFFPGISTRDWIAALLMWGALWSPDLPPILAAATTVALPATAEARSRGSGGYSRPSYTAPRTPSTSGGYARPRTPGLAAPTQRTPSPGDLELSRRGSAEALQRYRSSQQAEGPPYSGGPPRTYSPSTGRPGSGYDGWSPPAYAYRAPPRFGPWDALFLWFLLDTLNRPGHAQFFHNHQDDSAYRQWRAEADRMAEDNPQLRQKLANLDQSLAEQSGQPRTPGYLPPDVSPAHGRPVAGASGTGLWWLVIILGGVAIVLWWWRRPQSARRGTAAPRAAGQGGTMSTLGTLGNFFGRKLSGKPYRPSLFRVGMTLSLDPTPFILAGKQLKARAPVSDAGQLISVDAVGTVDAELTIFYRLYLPQRGFFQLHLDAGGQPDECRYFSVIDDVTPADQDEWSFWLDSREGAIGWPEFQAKDGKVYGRIWSPGGSRLDPPRLHETIVTSSGTSSAVSQAMLYGAPIGAAPPAPPTEYMLVEAIEQQGQAWVRIAAGIDINPASLSLA